jgi:hypothetical protein
VELKRFRTLVVTTWLLYVFYTFYTYLPQHLPVSFTPYFYWLSTYDARLIDLLKGHGYGALYETPGVVDVIVFSGWLLAALGMLFLQNWGRYLYLMLLALGFAQTAVSGVATLTPSQFVLLGVLSMLDGAVVVLAFLSPIAARFVSRAPSNSTPHADARDMPAPAGDSGARAGGRERYSA